MRGHHALIAMRLGGSCPSTAFVDVAIDPLQLWRSWPAGNPWSETTPHIEIPPHDRLSALDLRCFVGMTVLVSGQDEARTIRVAELCQEAGCKRCFVTVHDPITCAAISGFYFTEEVPPWQEF